MQSWGAGKSLQWLTWKLPRGTKGTQGHKQDSYEATILRVSHYISLSDPVQPLIPLDLD